ncbi:MAG TPA: hypothetical protein VN155_17030 [Devosia sp.]|nr:hypothetical protein [Devosia sp.]
MTRRTTISGHGIAALTLVACSIFFLVMERYFPSTRWFAAQLLSLPALLTYIWLLYRQQRGALFTSFYQAIYWAGILASALAISAGTYMIEIEKTGTANGTYWVALLFFVTGMEMTVIGYRRAGRKIPSFALARLSQNINRVFITAAVLPTLVLSAHILIVYRGPILMGVDRLSFFQGLPPLLAQLPNLATQTFFFAAFYFLQKRRDREPMKFAWFLVLAYLATGYLVLGQKFSLYVIYISTWLFIVPGLLPRFNLRKRYVLLGALGAVLIGALVAFTYLLEGKEVSFVLTRIALQAQLLWSVLNDLTAPTILPAANFDCLWGCGQYPTGREFISELYLPHHRYVYYESIGNAVSGFYPALPLLSLGVPAAMALHLLVSFILGWTQRKATNAFADNQMIYGFLFFKLNLGLTILIATGALGSLRGIWMMVAAIVLYHVLFQKLFWRRPAQST